MTHFKIQIEYFDNIVFFKQVTGDYAAMFKAAEKFEVDFMADGRQQTAQQYRDELC